MPVACIGPNKWNNGTNLYFNRATRKLHVGNNSNINGYDAELTAVVAGGIVTGVTVQNGGDSYPAGNPVEFLSDSGDGATATINVANGVITRVTVTNGGSGYLTPPTARPVPRDRYWPHVTFFEVWL